MTLAVAAIAALFGLLLIGLVRLLVALGQLLWWLLVLVWAVLLAACYGAVIGAARLGLWLHRRRCTDPACEAEHDDWLERLRRGDV